MFLLIHLWLLLPKSQFVAALQPISRLVFVSVLRHLVQVIAVVVPLCADQILHKVAIASHRCGSLSEVSARGTLSELGCSRATVNLRILILRLDALILEDIRIQSFGR